MMVILLIMVVIKVMIMVDNDNCFQIIQGTLQTMDIDTKQGYNSGINVLIYENIDFIVKLLI